MALPSSILVGILLCAQVFAQKDNGDDCSCFLTNGSSTGYFTNHRFLDFRSIAGGLATPPAIISNATGTANALATSDFFLNDKWTGVWESQNWNNSGTFTSDPGGPTVLMINSPNNVYIGLSNPPRLLSNQADICRIKQRQHP